MTSFAKQTKNTNDIDDKRKLKHRVSNIFSIIRVVLGLGTCLVS